VDLYIYSPLCLHGVVLNYLSTGTTLPLLLRIEFICYQTVNSNKIRTNFKCYILLLILPLGLGGRNFSHTLTFKNGFTDCLSVFRTEEI
jgi:hypothetical protein